MSADATAGNHDLDRLRIARPPQPARRGRNPVVSAAVTLLAASIVGAVAGVSLVVLWFFTPHIPPAGNQNLLQLNPAFLVLLPLIPLLRHRPRVSPSRGR